MITASTTEILKALGPALASRAPIGWSEIVIYFEFVPEKDAEPTVVSTTELMVNGKIEKKFFPSAEAYMIVSKLYAASAAEGDNWTGIAARFLSTGRYSTKFYYDSTPLADGDHGETARRIKDV